MANARLIAAAPETAAERDRLREINAELLDALREIALFASAHSFGDTDLAHIEEVARAAIAKGEGK